MFFYNVISQFFIEVRIKKVDKLHLEKIMLNLRKVEIYCIILLLGP